MKPKPRQIDIKWGGPEAFALVPEPAADAERIAAEKARKIKDQQKAESQQTELPCTTP